MTAAVNFVGTKKNPIELNCSCISKSNDGIVECVMKAIQNKIGFSNKIFRDKRYKYIKIVIKKNDCSSCQLGVNLCKVEAVVLPKGVIARLNVGKTALAV